MTFLKPELTACMLAEKIIKSQTVSRIFLASQARHPVPFISREKLLIPGWAGHYFSRLHLLFREPAQGVIEGLNGFTAAQEEKGKVVLVLVQFLVAAGSK